MFCPKCGSPIENGNKFCPKCGNQVDNVVVKKAPAQQSFVGQVSVEDTPQIAVVKPKKKQNKKLVGIICGILAAVIAAGVLVFVFFFNNSSYRDVALNYFTASTCEFNAEKAMSYLANANILHNAAEESITKDSYINKLKTAYELFPVVFSLRYGDNWSIDADISHSVAYDNDELYEINQTYKNELDGCEITAVYRVYVKYILKYAHDGKESFDVGSACVLVSSINGEWCVIDCDNPIVSEYDIN